MANDLAERLHGTPPSNRWSYLLKGIRKDLQVEGKNVAYAWHVYAGNGKNDPKQWADALEDLQTVPR